MLHITVVTPEKTLIDTEADELIAPTTTGEIAILPQHVPLVTQMAAGILTIKHNGKNEVLAVDGGFLQISEKEIIVLADYAVSGKDVSASQAEDAKRAAEKAMKDVKSEIELETLQDEIRRENLKLRVSKYKV